jgi:diguanylate cyclase (GGDEF)-like protein
MRWAQVYTQFESTQLRTTLSVPVYVAQRFRGVVAVDLEIRRLRDLIGLPEILGSHRYLLDRNGNVIVSSQTGGKTNLRWPDDFAGDLRNTAVSDLISQGTGMRHVNGQYVYFQRVGNAGNWLMVDTLDEYDVYATVARRLSLPLLTIWFLLPVLMYVTLRVVTLLFDHYLAAGRKLQQMAETDPLTQLANRRRFSEQFKKETARRQRDGTPLAMLMLDIDFFKRVNDKWGHASGDCVLMAMADLMRKHLREIDFPARLGGEEFAVLLPGASSDEAVAAAERLRLAVEAASVEAAPDAPHPDAGDGRIRFTVSIGVAEAGTDGCQTLDAMLAVADRRLYVAKEAGRNRVCATDATDAPAEVQRCHRCSDKAIHDQLLARGYGKCAPRKSIAHFNSAHEKRDVVGSDDRHRNTLATLKQDVLLNAAALLGEDCGFNRQAAARVVLHQQLVGAMADLERLVFRAQALPFVGAQVERVIEFVDRAGMQVAIEIAFGFHAVQFVTQRGDLALELERLADGRLHALGRFQCLVGRRHGAFPQAAIACRAEFRHPAVRRLDYRIHLDPSDTH